MTEVAEARRQIVDNVRKEIHGPFITDRGSDLRQLLTDSPDQTFSCGILFPQKTVHADHDEPNEAQEFSGEEDSFNLEEILIPTRGNSNRNAEDNEDQYLDDLDLSLQLRPSAMSISFRVRDCSDLNLRFYFATYSSKTIQDENGVSRRRYQRCQHRIYWQLKLDGLSSIYKEKELVCVDEESKKPSLIGSLMARSVEGSERSVTISIVNKIELDQSSRPDYRSMFFQPQLVAKTTDGKFVPVESSGSFGDDEELSELNLQYRELNSYCRGHGCAGEWHLDHDAKPTRVYSNLIPGYEVAGTAARTTPLNDKNILSFSFKDFSGIDTDLNHARTQIIKKLEPFCDDYSDWLSNQADLSKSLDDVHSAPSDRILGRIELTVDRMRQGIKKIAEDDDCLKSFILANRAMWLQQCHVKEEPRFLDKKFDNPTIDLDQRDDKDQHTRGWRPFQLAFLLINLYSIPTLDAPNPDDSDTVDLIWFPTGGGKTEAYLGLAAYSIVLSRLKNKMYSKGTEVLMRYTLRLLTGQQFQRATALICALEFLRKYEKNYSWEINNFTNGEEITIGLWVGQSLTPNKNNRAVSILKDLRKEKDGVKNPFQMFNCPWCKNDLEFASSIDKAVNKKTFHGYEISGAGKNQIVNFVCHDKDCCFDVLPIMVVDEQLYCQPPTLLIGTVDKFAQLSWLDETGNFFACRQKEVPPPSLIIQDELHLISGPLGSIVAHYEYLLRAIFSYSGFQPKIIASTATIRSASDQVQKLFASKVNIFPAPGLNYDDNYFSYTESAGLGRYYVGVFASATPSIVTAERNLAATLLQMPKLFFDSEEYIKVNYPKNPDEKISYEFTRGVKDPGIDPYGTLVWYFNSIRELGYAKTLLVQDIAEHFKVLQRRYQITWPLVGIRAKIEELTSRADEEEIGSIERNLKTEWSPFPDFSKKENIPIDVLLATNMISVGFDIDRLGLMLINGQPKNTAEYIQASSRVGRGTKGSGLVYTLYNHSRSRDRSHFENFFSYHQALYKNVEPTSITPMAPKARERSLPGLIIGLARHVLGLNRPGDLDDIGIEKIKSLLLPYIKDADDFSSKLGSDNVIDEVNQILGLWHSKVNSDEGDHLTWGTMGNAPDETDLTMPFGTILEPGYPLKIPLLMSMRNVDGESQGAITGRWT